jgi:hypothetical protein
MAMKIELSDQQEQAVKQGRPVEVRDPASDRAFIVLTRELYERVRSLLEGGPEQRPSPGAPPVAALVPESQPLRQRLADLPTPPAIAEAARRHCQKLGLWGAMAEKNAEEELKLQHYYGGQWVAYVPTKEGVVVLAAADRLDHLAFDRRSPTLTAEERRTAVLIRPSRFIDPDSEILTPFADEG